MLITSRLERRSIQSRRALPQTRFGDEFPDSRQPNIEWLVRQQALRLSGRNGQNKFKILSVAERVIERRFAIPRLDTHAMGSRIDRHGVDINHGTASALFRDAKHIESEPVTDVDRGRQSIMLVEQQ